MKCLDNCFLISLNSFELLHGVVGVTGNLGCPLDDTTLTGITLNVFGKRTAQTGHSDFYHTLFGLFVLVGLVGLVMRVRAVAGVAVGLTVVNRLEDQSFLCFVNSDYFYFVRS